MTKRKANKTIGIVGSRQRDAQQDFEDVLDIFILLYEEGDNIVSGGCQKGGDRFAEIIAEHYGLSVENKRLVIYYPNWKRNGFPAGFIRNSFIAEDADVLIACVRKDRKGGTEDTVRKFKKLGKSAKLYLALDRTHS